MYGQCMCTRSPCMLQLRIWQYIIIITNLTWLVAACHTPARERKLVMLKTDLCTCSRHQHQAHEKGSHDAPRVKLPCHAQISYVGANCPDSCNQLPLQSSLVDGKTTRRFLPTYVGPVKHPWHESTATLTCCKERIQL